MCLKDLFKKLVKGAALHPNFSKMKNILLNFVATGATVSLMARRTLEESLSTKQENLFPKPYKHMKIMRNFRLEQNAVVMLKTPIRTETFTHPVNQKH
eukprot:UN10962